jgi:hypothetical protein
MNKFKTLKLLLFVISITLIFIDLGCKKEEETIGCTDPNAVNYNPEGTSIPGSDLANCVYDTTCPNVKIIPFGDSINYPTDYFFIDTAFLSGNILNITVSYAGGCETHNFELYSQGDFCGTPPCYINLYLSHDSNNDLCEASLIETLCFDISTYISNDNYISLFDPVNNYQINFY